MSIGPPLKSRRLSVGAYLGMAGMAVAGIAGGVLAAWAMFAVAYTYYENALETSSWGGVFAVYTLFTLVPAVALWWTRNRYLRGFAAGLTVCWIAGAVLTWVGISGNDEGPEIGYQGEFSTESNTITDRLGTSSALPCRRLELALGVPPF